LWRQIEGPLHLPEQRQSASEGGHAQAKSGRWLEGSGGEAAQCRNQRQRERMRYDGTCVTGWIKAPDCACPPYLVVP
jgi:hypothetical protein